MLRYLWVLMLVLSMPVQAARLALVIGNGGYNANSNGLELGYLHNPVNDAKDMAEVLGKLGFEVILRTNADKKTMKQAAREFGKRLRHFRQAMDVGLFYYSGHGFQHDKVNYLVPLRADIQHEVDIEDEALRADYALRFMEYENKGINLVILDTCRSAIPENFLRKNKGFFDDLVPGLAEMKAPANSLIAYATQPNTDSLSGFSWERNSLYTKHLLTKLRSMSHLSIMDVFFEVRDQVMQETETEKIQQVPWESVSLRKRVCFGQCGNVSTIIDNHIVQTPVVVDNTAQKIAELLKTCQFRFDNNWLTSGANGTALACYQDVLKLDSNNWDASRGLVNIENRYVEWAERALKKGQKAKVRQYLARLRLVNSESPKLAGLELQLDSMNSQFFRDRLQDGSLGPEMVRIPKGQFRMGDIQGGGYDWEKPVHQVWVSEFAMGKYEVTVGEFRRFVNVTGYKTEAEKGDGCYVLNGSKWEKTKNANWRNPHFSQNNNHPVVCVSWNDAIAYAKWFSQQTGQQYRLPTEAEWEYATRAGTEYSRYWGNNSDDACGYANVADKTAKKKFSDWSIHNCTDDYIYTASVGSFKSNAFGLFDMLGNVWEWTCSEYESKYSGKEKNCIGKNHARQLVIRGGSWNGEARSVRTADRGRYSHDFRFDNVGFRLARITL